jgi:hypothetical protein
MTYLRLLAHYCQYVSEVPHFTFQQTELRFNDGGTQCLRNVTNQTTRRQMPVTTVTTTPCTLHSGTDTSLCAFWQVCIVAICGDATAVNWSGYSVAFYMCIHMLVLGCGAGEHNWHSPAHSQGCSFYHILTTCLLKFIWISYLNFLTGFLNVFVGSWRHIMAHSPVLERGMAFK